MATPERTEFRPSTLRRSVILVVAFVVFVAVFSLIGVAITGGYRPPDRVSSFFALCVIAGAVAVTLATPRRGRLIFSDEKVRGPGRQARQEVEFPLSRLDRRRTCQRRLHHRLLGYQVLYSVNDRKIWWNRAAFPREAVARVIDRLGCD